MIERHGNAETIAGDKWRAIGDELRIVDNVMVREHRTFRQPRGTRGVLDINRVVEFQLGFTLAQLIRRDRLPSRCSSSQENIPGWKEIPDEDNCTQIRQILQTGDRREQTTQFRADFAKNRNIV